MDRHGWADELPFFLTEYFLHRLGHNTSIDRLKGFVWHGGKTDKGPLSEANIDLTRNRARKYRTPIFNRLIRRFFVNIWV